MQKASIHSTVETPVITPFIDTIDGDRLAAFYCRALNAKEGGRVPPSGDVFSVILLIDDAVLGIVRSADGDDEYAGPPDPSRLAPPGRIVLDIPVPDPDAALRAIAAAGGDAADRANDMPWGRRIGDAKDLDGNELNLSAPAGADTPHGKE
ncbi:MAG: hypothetical protein L0G99_04840 [Propionibacteriales bacterium]|nr:hypothetical protein [Propionibacteriales bacterium]